ncbi:ribonuclease H-like domain-containing protein [Gilbertella persicaria]|uniref:ribonuclease H-like domain-containing protein n=1 Tax=Gilbertella persicaria TaxID=101096 RepID=UPI00221F614C|nr:ribonuclease H-like domain-containing protein [Gilbertella persicaria]KAI8082505.1 ribonuclease H-like domain-containing protein [Gilbertella persicaria]
MEITRQQFSQKLSTVEKAIKECDFMAIDTELSGLHRPLTSIRLYNMKDRYQEYKEATERFLIIQFGLCTFTWDEPSGRYIAKPFNFYIFPTSITGHIQTNRIFMTQAQAFDFLTKQSFDFNKWVYQGIPYMTRIEEEEYVSAATKKLQDDMPDIPIDNKELDFVNNAREMIQNFISKDKEGSDGINIITKNAYQKRLIYQEARKFQGITAIGMQGFIRIAKLSKEQLESHNKEKQEKFNKDCEVAIGFRRVIDMISESGKIIVGHNMLLDICHMIGQFVQPLPDTLDEFKSLAHRVFPKMIDTKYMSISEPELSVIFGSGTALETLRFETKKEAFNNPHIDMHSAFPRYLTEMAHEAGYDAFMTGAVFLRMVGYLDKKRNPEKYAQIEQERKALEEEKEKEKEKKRQPKIDADGWEISEEENDENSGWDDDEEIYNYGSIRLDLENKQEKMDHVFSTIMNKAALVRTAFNCFDFLSQPDFSDQFQVFHVSHMSDAVFSEQIASLLLSKYGKHIVEPNDDQSSFVIFENLREDPDNLVIDDDKFVITPMTKYLGKKL